MRTALESFCSSIMADEDCGDVQGPGWYGLVNGPIDGSQDPEGWAELTDDDRAALTECAGIIIREDSQGFISVDIIDDAETLIPTWDKIQAECAEFYTDEDEDEPSEGDYTITPCGSLGGMSGVGQVGGKFLGKFADDETALKFIRERMDSEQFWPNVWYVSDHGNWSLITNIGQSA